MTISIHPLTDTDFEAAATVLRSAFQRPGNWIGKLRFGFEIQPDGYCGAYQGNVLVGMVGATLYSNFAYVGLMGVHPEFQRRKIGFRLMQNLLDWLDEKNIHLTMLDASQYGQPLYRKLGFIPVERVLVFQGCPNVSFSGLFHQIKPISHANLDALIDLDTKIFGADRSKVLCALFKHYPERGLIYIEKGKIKGYLFVQDECIGPWVMLEGAGSDLLLRAALSLSARDVISVVVPGNNAQAIALMQNFGFEIARVNFQMMRGPKIQTGYQQNIFGKTSLSFG